MLKFLFFHPFCRFGPPFCQTYKLMRYERCGGILMLILVATGVLGKPLSAAIDAVYAWLVPLAQLACDGVFYLFFK